MPLPVGTLLSVARTGSRVVRVLIRPARPGEGLGGLVARGGRDPWLPAAPRGPLDGSRLHRGTQLVRRGLGLGVLALLAVLGAALLFPLLLVLGLAAANGSTLSAWLLGFTLLVGLVGAGWTVWRANALLRTRPEADLGAEGSDDPAAGAGNAAAEAELLGTLRRHERALPAPLRPAFHRTVIASRDALRATRGEATLSREAYDARQAAREALPELLEVYRAAPISVQNDAEFLRQLALIETRAADVVRLHAADRSRELRAHGRYLDGRFGVEGREGRAPEDGAAEETK